MVIVYTWHDYNILKDIFTQCRPLKSPTRTIYVLYIRDEAKQNLQTETDWNVWTAKRLKLHSSTAQYEFTMNMISRHVMLFQLFHCTYFQFLDSEAVG